MRRKEADCIRLQFPVISVQGSAELYLLFQRDLCGSQPGGLGGVWGTGAHTCTSTILRTEYSQMQPLQFIIALGTQYLLYLGGAGILQLR